jgi:hypothetical protein
VEKDTKQNQIISTNFGVDRIRNLLDILKYYILECKAMYSGRNLRKFRSNILPPSSRLKIKPSKKAASRTTLQKIVTSMTTVVKKNSDGTFIEILSVISEILG